MKRIVGVSACLLWLLVGLGPAEGGVIVLKDGTVLQGRIDKKKITDDAVKISWPYKGYTHTSGVKRGEWKLETRQIRWFDADSDTLTDDYFDKYADDKTYKLDPRFEDLRSAYLSRKKGESEIKEVGIDLKEWVKRRKKATEIGSVPISTKHFEIFKPRGWIRKEKLSIPRPGERQRTFMLVAPEPFSGYAARIHVSSVVRPPKSVAEQLEWYLSEVKRLSRNGLLEIREKQKETIRGDRSRNVELTTVTRHKGIAVWAYRAILFRPERVYFVTCYAHRDEFGQLKTLFRRCVEKLQLAEDDKR